MSFHDGYIVVSDYVAGMQPADEVICTACGRTWLDLDRAVNEFSTDCPSCGGVATVAPHYLADLRGEASA